MKNRLYSHIKTSYFIAVASFIFLLTICATRSFAQDKKGNLEIRGTVTYDNSPVKGAQIKATTLSGKIIAEESSQRGTFRLKLDYGETYILEITQQGYVTTSYEIATDVPEEHKDYNSIFEITTEFFPEIAGIDYSVLKKPLAYINYDKRYDDFALNSVKTGNNFVKVQEIKRQVDKAYKDASRYDKELAEANNLYNAKDYEKALQAYQRASTLKPTEQFPKDRITEISNMLAAQRDKEQNYKNAIAEGDKFFNSLAYERAKTAYENALSIKANEKYPRMQIDKINMILNDAANKEENYKKAIAEADNNFNNKAYENAKVAYQKALTYKPTEPYPTTRIAEINKLLRDNKAKRDGYNAAIAEGDKQYSTKNYTGARTAYEKALTFLPDEQYPKDKINEINKLLSDQKGLKDAYDKAIAEGDVYFNQKQYQQSKASYNNALSIFPKEKYPQDRIAEIDKLLALELNKNQAYDKAIAEADAAFTAKQYTKAKTAYELALTHKPNEQYPKDKIAEINKLLIDEQSRNENYNKAIADGDANLKNKVYDKAKTAYELALTYKPSEPYPKDKINEINKLISEQQNKQQAYDNAIAEGDKHFAAKVYDMAKNSYQIAITVKPNEQYPKNKIAEIDQILADLKKKKDEYDKLIAEADKNFNKQSYSLALTSYQSASALLPSEQYPKDKINEINKLLSNQKALKEAYDKAIAEGDVYFNQKQYQQSKASYNNALSIFPKEKYPQDRIAEIDKLLALELNKNQAYDKAIAEADAAFTAKQYTKAKTAYELALTHKPNEQYPKDKIAEINKIIADEQSRNENYNKTIADADENYKDKIYDKAKAAYELALTFKPSEQYPKDKITEINKILSEQQNKQQAYSNAIADGDKNFASKTYDMAKNAYQLASSIKPNEQYPKDKITEIDQILADLKKKKEEYDKLIADGNKQFDKQNYEPALTAYQAASALIPTEQYPKDKINEINKLLSDQKSKKEQYDKLIASADAAFTNKQYENAKTNYQNASTIFPSEKYPKDKINEINQILAEAQNKQQAYDNAIAEGDKNFNNKVYDMALASYQLALKILPSQTYPQNKITEINNILAEIKKKQDAYDKAIADGDAAFNTKLYTNAKPFYQQAAQIMPDKQYPKDRISEIDKILADQKNQQLAYDNAIAEGDKQFNAKIYDKALVAYQNASSIKPSESYPKGQITKINALLAEQQKKKDAYDKAIAEADAAFNKQQYDAAKISYQNALTILPNETYPKNKISEIDKIIADAKNKKQAYDNAIAEGDKLFNEKNYQKALTSFQTATSIFPNETYPQTKITEINKLLAELLSKQEAYNNAIANADKLFSAKSYESAKTGYQDALKILPNETYPQNKIKEIDNILSQQLKQKQDYNNAIAEGDKNFNAKQYAQAKTAYQQASTIFPNEVYPKEKINEIDRLLADAVKKQEYDKYIAEADGLYNQKKYNEAIEAYQKALGVFANEVYPKNKISEIEKIIADTKNKKQAYDNAVAEGDKAFGSKIYDKAKLSYQEALNYFPDENYPKTKIAEINKIIDAAATEQKLYSDAIAEGDKAFTALDYTKATQAYQNALKIRPTETYPKNKINEIEGIIASQKSKRENYDKLIADGDNQLKAKNYPKAKTSYTQASELFPNEQYPKDKLKEVNKMLADLQNVDIAYTNAINEGDKQFRGKAYDDAIKSYEYALRFKPNEKYPKDKIEECKQIIADNKEIQKFYAKGFIDVNTNTINIPMNNEKKFTFISFDQKKNGSYVVITAKNLSQRDVNVFFNYGRGLTKNGGFTFKIPKGGGNKDFNIPISSHISWISERNNWFSIYPAGGSIEVSNIKIVFGN